ncbi:MAG: type III pantothenate kinase [Bacteroidia bacterium]|nr:type III pantothenate kinase [Bacteroidia bacterium]
MNGAAIDIGNTRIKTAIFNDGKIQNKLDFENFKDLTNFIKEFKIDVPVIISDVTNSDIKSLNQYIKSMIILNNNTPIPIKNKYQTPETLGNDRLAAVIGAWSVFKDENILVIDIGTCIKYDFINKNNEYIGGSISPGIEMKFQALNRFTQKLPFERKDKIYSFCGTNTSDAIKNGVMFGTFSEINGLIKEYKNNYDNLKIIFTGGDMMYFADKIKDMIFADPDLVLKGLYHILKYNVK